MKLLKQNTKKINDFYPFKEERYKEHEMDAVVAITEKKEEKFTALNFPKIF
jgi:hypothetical protein